VTSEANTPSTSDAAPPEPGPGISKQQWRSGLAAWLVAGWALGFPRSWELVATVGLPVVTLVLLIVVQHTQNHDDRAIQLKLDEVIRALERASNSMIRVDEGSWEDLEHVREHFRRHVAPDGREQGRTGEAGATGAG